jgi:precorrin-2 dehydrogenase
MTSWPVALEVGGRRAVAIGAGVELDRKVEALEQAGASVARLEATPGDDAALDTALADVFLVLLAPGDDAAAARLHAWAVPRGRLVCTIDRPETCTFTGLAVARAGGLTLTVSTGGASPGLARRVREDLEAALGDARVARFLASLRALRAELPRGERARRLAAAVRGFRLDVRLHFPPWFERGDPPP